MAEFFEPEARESREHFALADYWRGRNTIESRDAISSDDEQAIFIDCINIANFPTSYKLEIGESCFNNRSYAGHCRFLSSFKFTHALLQVSLTKTIPK